MRFKNYFFLLQCHNLLGAIGSLSPYVSSSLELRGYWVLDIGQVAWATTVYSILLYSVHTSISSCIYSYNIYAYAVYAHVHIQYCYIFRTARKVQFVTVDFAERKGMKNKKIEYKNSGPVYTLTICILYMNSWVFYCASERDLNSIVLYSQTKGVKQKYLLYISV